MVRRTLRMGLLSAALMASAASGAATLSQVQALGLAAAATQTVTVPDPAQQLTEMARLFRANDLVGLLRAAMPEARYAQVRAEYEEHRQEPIDAEKRAEFVREWGRIIAPGAVEALMAEIEPKLAEARPKIAGAKLMAVGALQMAASGSIGDAELTESQRESLNAVLPGLMAWMSNTDFLSEQTLRQALGYFADAARGTGIRSIDDLRALNFEQLLSRAGSLLAAGKRGLALYGLDVDAIAASLRVEVLEINGDRAKVRTTVTVFEAPISTEHELHLVEGRWGGPFGFKALNFRHGDHDHDHDHDHEKGNSEAELEADA